MATEDIEVLRIAAPWQPMSGRPPPIHLWASRPSSAFIPACSPPTAASGTRPRAWKSAWARSAFRAAKKPSRSKSCTPVILCIVPKLSETSTGNTLCDKSHPLTLPVPEYPNSLLPGGHPAQDPGRFDQDQPHPDPPVRRRYDPHLAHGNGHQPDHPAGHGRPAYRRRHPPRRNQIPGRPGHRSSPRCLTRKPSPKRARPCTATRSRPAVPASLAKFTCGSSRSPRRTLN